jgi:carbamoyltransferase
MKILGISAYYHDSAAALIEDGEIIAAAQEERFSRKKNDERFPENSIKYCLSEAGLNLSEIDAVVFYDKPFLKFERLLETYFENVPKGWISFITSMPVWLKEKLFLKSELKKSLKKIDDKIDWSKTQLLFSKHHLSHAASAYFPSNFDDAAILTLDGVGEWATASITHGKKNNITSLVELQFPDSIGLLYSAFTYFLGFEVNSGEYKVMGLAPYASPQDTLVLKYKKLIENEIVKIFEDGSIELNQHYFRYATSLRMIHEKRFEKLFKIKIRDPKDTIAKEHYSLAQALQLVVEDVVLKMAKKAKELTQSKNLCMAGGVALNCVANGKLKETNLFENIFVQPAAGDAGGALGAALAAHYMHFDKEKTMSLERDSMNLSRLGPSFTEQQIKRCIERNKLQAEKLSEEDLIEKTSELLSQGLVVGWFQGRMEFGPRALGGRSILGNPLLAETQSKLNLKVKKRESFRPFAPIMLPEDFQKFFNQNYESPYMLFVHKILPEYRKQNIVKEDDLIETINQVRSVLPSITHVDYSARIQTVGSNDDKKLHKLLEKFKDKTGYGVLVNTSFNVKDEPIVCSPEDAVYCFLNTDIDCLVMENYLILKTLN